MLKINRFTLKMLTILSVAIFTEQNLHSMKPQLPPISPASKASAQIRSNNEPNSEYSGLTIWVFLKQFLQNTNIDTLKALGAPMLAAAANDPITYINLFGQELLTNPDFAEFMAIILNKTKQEMIDILSNAHNRFLPLTEAELEGAQFKNKLTMLFSIDLQNDFADYVLYAHHEGFPPQEIVTYYREQFATKIQQDKMNPAMYKIAVAWSEWVLDALAGRAQLENAPDLTNNRIKKIHDMLKDGARAAQLTQFTTQLLLRYAMKITLGGLKAVRSVNS